MLSLLIIVLQNIIMIFCIWFYIQLIPLLKKTFYRSIASQNLLKILSEKMKSPVRKKLNVFINDVRQCL